MSVYAQEYGYFYNSNNSDRTYNADSFETWLKPFFVSGVFTNCLQVKAQTTPDMTVTVTSGYANLNGKAAYWPDDNVIQLDAAPGIYSRIDTIVLRRDDTNRCATIEYVKGTASSSPVATPPTRTGDIFELVLAQILVGTGVTAITQSVITDTRIDTDICGYVVAAVQSPDFSELYIQFTDDFQDWYNHIKGQLDEDAAGHLQNEVDALDEKLDDFADDVNENTSARDYSDLETVPVSMWPPTTYIRDGRVYRVVNANGVYAGTPFDSLTTDDITEVRIADDVGKALQRLNTQDNLNKSIEKTIAYFEEASPGKATRNYSTGDYIIINHNLYKTTADITTGTSLSVGTNLTTCSKGIGNDLNSKFTIKYYQLTGTTSSSGAIEIPADYKTRFISAYCSSQAALVFRRDYSYLTVKDNTTLAAVASTSVTIIIYYLSYDVSA